MKTLVPLAEHGALAKRMAGGEVQPVEFVEVCACGAPLGKPHPRALAVCRACVANQARVERRRDNLRAIPERYRWADLERPMVPPGKTALAVPDEARWRAREWLESSTPQLAIWGDSTPGRGKSSLAAAVMRGAIDRGVQAFWVLALSLSPTRDHLAAERLEEGILRAQFVIIDGLGQELAGAGGGAADGVARQRSEIVHHLVQKLHPLGREGPRVVWTIDLTDEQFMANYDGGNVRRLAMPDPDVMRIDLGTGRRK